MQDSTLLVLILIAVSLGTIVQTVALAGAIVGLRRLEEKFREVEQKFHRAERELLALRPRIEQMGKMIDNLSELSETAAEAIPRVTREVENAVDQFRSVASIGAMVLSKPLRPLGAAMAIWKGLKNGARAYRSLRPAKVAPTAPWTVIP